MIGAAETAGAEEDQDDIAFADVIFSLFSVLLILLLIVPVGVISRMSEAPTRNRMEPEFVTIRDCYMETLRPTSQFLLFSAAGLEIIDYDTVGRVFAEGDVEMSFNVDQWRASVRPAPNGADANVFTMTLQLSDPPEDVGAESDSAAMVAFLDMEVYGPGYVPYFEVRASDIASFAPLFTELLAEGRRFRWRILHDRNWVERGRTASSFESADFCR